MILVIDGYNVIKQALLKNTISDSQRERFIKQLGKYRKIRGHKIELVFDGGSYDWPTREKVNGVYLIYSGYNESADHYIKRYLKEHKSLDILLVSSDRDICNCAARLGIEYIDSKEFYKIMQNRLKLGLSQKTMSQAKAIKLSESEDEELDALMQDASKIVQYKTEDLESLGRSDSRESRAHTVSKKERKKLKKIKKL